MHLQTFYSFKNKNKLKCFSVTEELHVQNYALLDLIRNLITNNGNIINKCD